MGRQQQIVLAAARAAHEARRAIGSLTGEDGVPSFEALEQSQRNSVITHTFKVLTGESVPVDDSDRVAMLVRDVVEAYDESLKPPKTETEAPVLHVRLMDDTGTMVTVDSTPVDAIAAPDPMKEETK